MWYLIIPPVIVIISFSLILWFFGRKSRGAVSLDTVPERQEEISDKPSFGRCKTFVLKLLEKITQKSKIISLKIHNVLNDVTQKLRTRRQAMQEKMNTPSLFSTDASEESAATNPWSRLKREVRIRDRMKSGKTGAIAGATEPRVVAESEISSLETTPSQTEKITEAGDILTRPLLRRSHPSLLSRFSGASNPETVLAKEKDMSRPMVGDKVHPETMPRKKALSDNIAGEEKLIAQIAANPKDFATYETLGDYYMEVGNIKDAKECYRQVLKLSPVHRMVKIKIRRLEKLLSQKAG